MIRATAIRCEKPQGVIEEPNSMLHAGERVVTMFFAPESGREYMRIVGDNGEDWFRISKVIHQAAA
jgi:hypothetical protein